MIKSSSKLVAQNGSGIHLSLISLTIKQLRRINELDPLDLLLELGYILPLLS